MRKHLHVCAQWQHCPRAPEPRVTELLQQSLNTRSPWPQHSTSHVVNDTHSVAIRDRWGPGSVRVGLCGELKRPARVWVAVTGSAHRLLYLQGPMAQKPITKPNTHELPGVGTSSARTWTCMKLQMQMCGLFPRRRFL